MSMEPTHSSTLKGHAAAAGQCIFTFSVRKAACAPIALEQRGGRQCGKQEQARVCRAMQIGISAHQKLEKLSAIVECMGYQSIPVFGDCFDEVTYLDPVLYPEAMKQFASSVRTSV